MTRHRTERSHSEDAYSRSRRSRPYQSHERKSPEPKQENKLDMALDTIIENKGNFKHQREKKNEDEVAVTQDVEIVVEDMEEGQAVDDIIAEVAERQSVKRSLESRSRSRSHSRRSRTPRSRSRGREHRRKSPERIVSRSNSVVSSLSSTSRKIRSRFNYHSRDNTREERERIQTEQALRRANGTNRLFGIYNCKCNNHWNSGDTWENQYQKCRKCGTKVWPDKERLSEIMIRIPSFTVPIA